MPGFTVLSEYRKKYPEILYMTGFISYFIFYYVRNNTLSWAISKASMLTHFVWLDRLIYLSLGILILRECFLFFPVLHSFFQKTLDPSQKQYLLQTVFAASCTAALYFSSGRVYFVLPIILLYFARYTHIETLLKGYLVVFIALMLFWIIGYRNGILSDAVYYYNYTESHSYGFSNPNTGPFTMLTGGFAIWYLFGQNHRLLTSLAAIVLGICSWHFFNCRSAPVVLTFFILLIWVLPLILSCKEEVPVRKLFCFLFQWAPPLLLVFSFLFGAVLVQFRSSSESQFACRFVEGIYAIREIGFHPFQISLSSLDRKYFLDNAYFSWLFFYGYLPGLVLHSYLLLLNRKILKYNAAGLLCIAVCIYLYMLMERVFFWDMGILFLTMLYAKPAAADKGESSI